MLAQLRSNWRTLAIAFLIFYFGFHALAGDGGLLTWSKRNQMMAARTEELKQLNKFVRDNTLERFGPVRSVKANRDFGLVLEVAFEGLQRSTRHKSGVAMRFPRISRIRWDKPAREADEFATLERMLETP